MNTFDKMIAELWEHEVKRCKPAEPDFNAFDRIVSKAMNELYKSRPEDEADEIIYRSNTYGRVSIGTALMLQRRIILKILDKAC